MTVLLFHALSFHFNHIFITQDMIKITFNDFTGFQNY